MLYVTYGCADCLFDKRGGFGLFSWVKDRDLGFANGERRCTFRGSERRENSLLIVNGFFFFTYMTIGRKESAKYIQKLLIVFFSDITRKKDFAKYIQKFLIVFFLYHLRKKKVNKKSVLKLCIISDSLSYITRGKIKSINHKSSYHSTK